MTRSIAFTFMLVTAMLTALALFPARAFASGTSRFDCEASLARGDCPQAAYPGGVTARCNGVPCVRNNTRGLSTAEMIYLHERATGDAVPASAAATWSSALAQTQSAMADATAAEHPRRGGAASKTAPNSRRDAHPSRKRDES